MAGKARRAYPRLLLLLSAVFLVLLLAVFVRLRGGAARSRTYERSTFAMGTYVQLRAAGPSAPAALDAAIAEIGRLDDLLSYNSEQSDVFRLNGSAGRGPVSVSADTAELLELALHYAEVSGGLFDPTVGPVVDVWGFRPEMVPAVPDRPDLERALALVGYRDLRVDREAQTAELLRPGMSVDLGAIAKGYVVDRVVEVLRAQGVASAIIDVGGNICGVGPRPDGQAWMVGIRHPRMDGELLGSLPLTDSSIATSGDYQRNFEANGRLYHHLIEPLTGYPGTGVAAISVIARSAVEGDAISTAAFLSGPERALEFVRTLGLEGVLYTADGRLEVTPGLRDVFEARMP